jgi:hypothetical protein
MGIFCQPRREMTVLEAADGGEDSVVVRKWEDQIC